MESTINFYEAAPLFVSGQLAGLLQACRPEAKAQKARTRLPLLAEDAATDDDFGVSVSRLAEVQPELTRMIRTAEIDDLASIGVIARAAYAKYKPRIGREPAPMAADYGADVRAGRIVVLVLDRDVVAYMVAWPDEDAYFIENIGVEPRLQGQGWGRRLMDWAGTEARRLSLPSLRLYTNVAMTENLSIYAHLGFVETHRVVEEGFNRVYMRLDLENRA